MPAREITPPTPAPFTADEHAVEGAASALSRSWVTGLRRTLYLVLAVLLAGAALWGVGYYQGRASVQPAPGREAELQRSIDLLARVADSLEHLAASRSVALAVAQQALAAAPTVRIVDSAHVEIPDAMAGREPRVVAVPVELAARLSSLERSYAAALAYGQAEHQRAEAEKARADSAVALAHAAEASRPSRVGQIAKGVGLLVLGVFIGRGTR